MTIKFKKLFSSFICFSILLSVGVSSYASNSNNLFRLQFEGKSGSKCLNGASYTPTFEDCDKNATGQVWKWSGTGQLISNNGLCLQTTLLSANSQRVNMATCQNNLPTQQYVQSNNRVFRADKQICLAIYGTVIFGANSNSCTLKNDHFHSSTKVTYLPVKSKKQVVKKDHFHSSKKERHLPKRSDKQLTLNIEQSGDIWMTAKRGGMNQIRVGTHSYYNNLEKIFLEFGQINYWDAVGKRINIGHPDVAVLQTDSGIPEYPGVIILPGVKNKINWHSNDIYKLIYGCLVGQNQAHTHYWGCQTNVQKYAISSYALRERDLHHDPLKNSPAQFEARVFAGGKTPDIWALPVANPTGSSIDDLRAGDYLFSKFGIFAITAQPGSYAKTNGTLGGNYYNSMVVGKLDANFNYGTPTEKDNYNEGRPKPDLVSNSYNGAGASSWTTGTLAAEASSLLSLSKNQNLIAREDQPLILKAVMMTGATKTGFTGVDQKPYQWSNNPPSAPLDPWFGAGNYNTYHALQVMLGGLALKQGGRQVSSTGWKMLNMTDYATQTIEFDSGNGGDEFSLILTWSRDVTPVAKEQYTTYLADFRVELREGNRNKPIVSSDIRGHNVEHIYLKGLKPGTRYTITVTRKDANGEAVKAAIAWQTRDFFKTLEITRPQY